MNNRVLNIEASVTSDVHEATKPAVEVSSMLLLNFFISFPIRSVAMKSIFSKYVSTGKDEF